LTASISQRGVVRMPQAGSERSAARPPSACSNVGADDVEVVIFGGLRKYLNRCRACRSLDYRQIRLSDNQAGLAVT
jgi:hypothetical protein